MEKVGILVANGFEETETIVPYDLLSRTKKVEVIKIGITDIEDSILKLNDNLYIAQGSHKGDLLLDIKANSIILDSEGLSYAKTFSAIVVPGGMRGAMNISKSEYSKKLLLDFYSEKKLIAAICASPAVVLGKFGIVSKNNESKAICYPGCENLSMLNADDINQIYKEGKEHIGVVVDNKNNIITAKAAGCSFNFAYSIIAHLFDNKLADNIFEEIYFER